jgi:nitrogen fixation protein FixH
MMRRFTGWHMTGIIVAMFGIVIAVNFLMAGYAIGTFGGTVVDNSYVASQRFNQWLGEARAQRRLNWAVDATVEPGRIVVVTARGPGGAMNDAVVAVVATHPLGRLPQQALAFRRDGEGRFVATRPLPAGRWLLLVDVRDGGREARYNDEIPA